MMADDTALQRWYDIALDERRAQRFRRRVMARLPRRRQQRQAPTAALMALAAATLVAVALAVMWWPEAVPPPGPTTVEPPAPPAGGVDDASAPIVAGAAGMEVALPGDGAIHLTAGARLWRPTAARRAWRLESGRARCRVDGGAMTGPFRLRVTGATIDVLGTRFTAVSGAMGGVEVVDGRVGVTDATGVRHELGAGQRLAWLEHGFAPSRLVAHWPLDGGTPAVSSPPLRAQAGTTMGELTEAGSGLRPGALLLCDDPDLLTAPIFALRFRYRATAALGPDAKALVRRMGQTDGRLERGVHLAGRPHGDEPWQLGVTLRLDDGERVQLRMDDPYRTDPEREITLFVSCDGFTWRCYRDGELIAATDLPATPQMGTAVDPLVLGPAPGWIRDVRIWRGVKPAPGN